jgi:hypothetical protein
MNPDFEPRYRAAKRGEHAPRNMCECNERDGGKGTFATVVIQQPSFFGKKRYTLKQVWVPFEKLSPMGKRMSCYGAGQGRDGDWYHLSSSLQIGAYIQSKRAEKLRRMAWRSIPNAIWAIFRLMEDAAKRAEANRLEKIHTALARHAGAHMELGAILDTLDI